MIRSQRSVQYMTSSVKHLNAYIMFHINKIIHSVSPSLRCRIYDLRSAFYISTIRSASHDIFLSHVYMDKHLVGIIKTEGPFVKLKQHRWNGITQKRRYRSTRVKLKDQLQILVWYRKKDVRAVRRHCKVLLSIIEGSI